MKKCRKCKKNHPTELFRRCKKRQDGYDSICKKCYNELNTKKYNKKYRSTPRGHAINAWYSILQRAENKNGKHPSYAKIKVLVSKEQFLEWAIPNYENWMDAHPGEPPSVDRINNKGHYEFGNLQIISRWENNWKEIRVTEGELARRIVKRCKKCRLDFWKLIDCLKKEYPSTPVS